MDCCYLRNVFLLVISAILLSIMLFSFAVSEIKSADKITNIKADLELVLDVLLKKDQYFLSKEDNADNRHLSEMVVSNTERKIEELKLLCKFTQMHYDKTGRPDFALDTLGAEIISIHDTEILTFLGLAYSNTRPRAILQPSVFPGECFGFKGPASITIKLMGKIYLDEIGIEHIPVELSPTGNIFSAPKDFSLWALKSRDDQNPYFIDDFSYDINKNPLQLFSFKKTKTSYGFVNIKFRNNHGHKDHTCVYRVRVYGYLDQSN